MIPFKEVYSLLRKYGPATVTSSRNTRYSVEARLIKDVPAIICHPRSGRVAIHEDCWGDDLTCQKTRAGGLYNGPYSIFDWYRETCSKHDIEPATSAKNNPTSREVAMIGETAHLQDIVAYQEGAIVSREIIKKSVATVTVFAFDQGQGLSEHTAPFDAMVYLLDGEAQITISGKPHMVKAGEYIIVPANQPHAVQAQKRFKMMLVMIRG